MRLGRFERKILAAIAAVAIVPLLGAILLGERALSEALEVGVNPRVRTALEQNLQLYRDHFAALKADANHTADAIAHDHRLMVTLEQADEHAARARLRELVARYPTVAAAAVRTTPDGGELVVQRSAPAGRFRELPLARPLPGGGRITITVRAPEQPFADYQRAGEMTEVFAHLEQESELISGTYLFVYMAFLLSVIVMALAVGIVLSRRVTRRVAVLAEATERVGAGDLTVQVQAEANDEIADLTNAFNAMVRDMRESRGRIEYLQRIGAWQEFARRLAHEIKNPLTPIQLAIQEVHRSYDGQDPRFRERLDDALSIIEEEVATLRRLTGEFSAFAKLPEATLEPADLGDFLRDAERSLEHVPEDYRRAGALPTVEVVCEPGEAPLPVRIDGMMLKRGLDNLVRNAVQALATRRDGREGGLVRVRASRDGPHACLDVDDDGPGIPDVDLERIFDPYFTTKADGTGLGLAIVKKVVLEHAGEIAAERSELGGARFRIRLPVQLAPRSKAS